MPGEVTHHSDGENASVFGGFWEVLGLYRSYTCNLQQGRRGAEAF